MPGQSPKGPTEAPLSPPDPGPSSPAGDEPTGESPIAVGGSNPGGILPAEHWAQVSCRCEDIL